MFTLYKLFGQENEINAVAFDFSIGEGVGLKYILKENEENEVTKFLKKFNMYDKIRFVDGYSYNINVIPNYNLATIDMARLDEIKFDEIDESYGIVNAADGHNVYSLDILDTSNIIVNKREIILSLDILTKII